MATHIQLSDLQAAIFWNGALLLALILAFFIQWLELKRLKLDLLSSFVVVAVFNVALVLGSRLGAIDLVNWKYLFWQGHGFHSPGKTVMGGLLLALPLFWLLKKYWHLEGTHADAIFIGLPLAAAVSRLGCAAAGCCHGVITTSAFSWTYGPGMPAYDWQLEHGFIHEGAEVSLPVYPVQLLFVIACLILFIFLWRIRKKLKHGGSLALLVVALLLLNRFCIEFLREATTNRGLLGATVLGLKAVQWFCLVGGLFMLAMFWRNERKKIEKENLPAGIPLGQMTWVMLFVIAILLLFRNIFSFDELSILLLSCVPVLGLLARKLWQEWTFLPNRLATTSVLSLTGILFLFTSLDTIPMMQKGNQWIDIGTGGTLGDFRYVYRNCDGDVIDEERLKLNSAGVDASYHYQLNQKTNIGAGVHGSFGKLTSEDAESEHNYRYSAFGPYLSLNSNWIGLRGGPLFISHNQIRKTQFENSLGPAFSAYFRLGKIHKYYFDAAINDYPGFHYYPEPSFNIGLFNWAFEDYSGAKNISLGLTSLQGIEDEIGFYISGRVPLGKTMFNLNGGLYFQNGTIFSLGLNYRWRIDE